MKKIIIDDPMRLRLAIASLVLLVGACLYFWLSGRLSPMLTELFSIFENRETLRNYVEKWGKAAPVVFIFIQALQVVIAPIPGEFTGAVGGFIFGALPNTIYSTIGLSIGSMAAFLAAKVIGMPLVKYFVSEKSLERFHFLTERRGAAISLILFAIPGFPKDILSYILGLSPMGVFTFFWVSAIGRIPGTIMLSLSGSAVFEEDWTSLVTLLVVCALTFALVFLQRDRIERWLRRQNV
ncbi:MAG: TVP38/TMEM64 family protein [Deltaproteobacteria bacterium]|nr:TVP38/TMEM64 family protein [Deltaproteobacteria bacterium]